MKLNITFLLLFALFFYGCSKPIIRKMEVTSYCGCGECCGWERGSWKYLKLNFWNRYVNVGKRKGLLYTGLTASGTEPNEPIPGLFSIDSYCPSLDDSNKNYIFPLALTTRRWHYCS